MIPRFPGDAPKDLSKPLEEVRLRVDKTHAGKRLDQVLAHFLHWRSRAGVRRLLDAGFVELLGRPTKPGIKLRPGDEIVVTVPPSPEPVEVFPDEFELPIVYEDRWLVAVDKPAGLPVHPAGRRVYGTLIHFMHKRYRRPDDPAHDVVPRLLHRLDRETSGVVALGLEEQFQGIVGQQFENREVAKVYQAVVHGRPATDEGSIDYGIGPDARSPIRLKLEAKRDGSGLHARTDYRVLRGNDRYTLVEVRPKTGRTHQIRVHLAAIGCPLVGDKIYGLDEGIFLEQLTGELSEASRAKLVLDRHALHAAELCIFHPFREETLCLRAELPADMAALVD